MSKTGFVLVGVLLGLAAAYPFAVRPATVIDGPDGARLYIHDEDDIAKLANRFSSYEALVKQLRDKLAAGGCS